MTFRCSIAAACIFFMLQSLRAASLPIEAAPLFTSISGPVSIPAEIVDHAMFVSVRVNGQGPFRVLLDTGCSVTLISPELATAAGVAVPEKQRELVSARNGLGGRTDLMPVVIDSIDLGAVRFGEVPAAVSDSFESLSTIEGLRIDGTLGFPLFSHLFVGLDFPNRRILLGKSWPAGVPAIRAELPLVQRSGVPFVQVQIQGKTVEVMIDTGANHGLQIPGRLVSSFQWKVTPRIGTMVAAFDEVGREQIGRLGGSLFIGGIQEVEPTTDISSGPASLGLRSLERFCVIFHPSGNKVWLCRADSAPIMPTAERSIGLSLYPDRGGLRIVGVIPGSPAQKANLGPGELVTEIEHCPASSWTRDKMEKWINSRPNIALIVSGKTGERALTLPVWNLVP
jgi:predicted aspartyl protease